MFIMGYNRPGCLPDTGPWHYDTRAEAIGALIYELETGCENANRAVNAVAELRAMPDLDEPVLITCDGYIYWVIEEEHH